MSDGGGRRSWTTVLAPLFVVALLLVGCAARGHQGASSATGADAIPASDQRLTDQHTSGRRAPPCADQRATDKMLLSTTPDGPAQDAVTGTAVSTSFSLANGAFAADPPPADYQPAVTAQQAGCQLAAAMGVRGFAAPPGRLALAAVSIAGGLQFQSSGGTIPECLPWAAPDLPAPGRLDSDLGSGQQRVQLPHPSALAISGRSGQCRASAPVRGLRHRRYDRCQPDHVRGPLRAVRGHVLVPGVSLRSVPDPVRPVDDRVPSRRRVVGADHRVVVKLRGLHLGGDHVRDQPERRQRHTAQPATSASPLHAWVERPRGGLGITVNRPFGPDCGSATAHSLTLHPAVVGATIPDTVSHDPLGLVAPQVD